MSVTLDSGNVVIGTANQTGILIAPVGTAAPTTVTEDWGAGWQTLGYLSEDGLTLTKEVESETIAAWQSRAPLRTIITGKTLRIGMTLIELTPLAFAVYFGEAVPAGTDDEFTLTVLSDSTAPEWAVGLDIRDGDVVVRAIAGRAGLSENGEVSIQSAQEMGLPVTLDCLDDDGVLMTIIKGSVGVAS